MTEVNSDLPVPSTSALSAVLASAIQIGAALATAVTASSAVTVVAATADSA